MVFYVVEKLPGGRRSTIVSRHVDVAYPEPVPEIQLHSASMDKSETKFSVSTNRERKSVVIIRSTRSPQEKMLAVNDDRRLFQSCLDEVTHQKKSMFIVALEELASSIMNLMPASIRDKVKQSDVLTASVIYNMRHWVPKRTLSTLSTARVNYDRHVPSEDAPLTPTHSFGCDRLDAVVSAAQSTAVRTLKHRQSIERHLILGEEFQSMFQTLLDFEVEERHVVAVVEQHERTRLSQYEVGAHAILRFALQESLRSEALKRASRALQGQVEALQAEATRRIQHERQESLRSRRDLNNFFDESEKKLLKPADMNWVDVEIERAVARHSQESSFFPGVL